MNRAINRLFRKPELLATFRGTPSYIVMKLLAPKPPPAVPPQIQAEKKTPAA
jgi:hypothetical protein